MFALKIRTRSPEGQGYRWRTGRSSNRAHDGTAVRRSLSKRDRSATTLLASSLAGSGEACAAPLSCGHLRRCRSSRAPTDAADARRLPGPRQLGETGSGPGKTLTAVRLSLIADNCLMARNPSQGVGVGPLSCRPDRHGCLQLARKLGPAPYRDPICRGRPA